ncbi:hypothetical protein QBC35DRAFT_458745 [Podospora australis]|uniref:Uncharacterized protein n=1 Tax=Podospora australis TaxID=1536484 RepID=A0AAN6X2X0_9PEZI|nr:hypothetical protein QBC35DRAFT_458745 [Podospora australis]
MLAAHHDQENVYLHQADASKHQLQAKTPGARYPKTPLKVPLNDENANHGFGGKSILKSKGNNENNVTLGKGNVLGKPGKQALVTPAPRTGRAPLGNKTTNAKARANEHPHGGKETVKTGQKPTTTNRQKQAAPQIGGAKVEVRTDTNPLADDDEPEYAPPKPQDLPYESDVCPGGVLTFEGLKPENLFNGYYQYYFHRVDDNGKTALERSMEERQQRNFELGDEQIRLDMEEFDWSISDVPESKDLSNLKSESATVQAQPVVAVVKKTTTALASRQPSTLSSRRAATALATTSKAARPPTSRLGKPTTATATLPKVHSRGLPLLPKRKPTQPVVQTSRLSRQRAGSVTASRSTLGYSKGRSVLSSATQAQNRPTNTTATTTTTTTSATSTATPRLPESAPKSRSLTRCVSTASSGSSDATITPARFAQSSQDWKKPDFLSIFDVDDDDDTLCGLPAGVVPPFDESDDDFQLSTDF